MNYRHAFHAGNFADVVKHVVLICLLDRLAEKSKPMCYVETHAGRGGYDLADAAARRSGEFAGGIGRVESAAPGEGPVADYLRIVRGFDLPGARRPYPGSPCIAAATLRAGDRAVLCEALPEEAAALRRILRADRRFSVRQEDGYQGIRAVLPPNPRRGLVLLDPPYESVPEEDRVVAALAEGLGRWATGVFALWYPVKDGRDARRLRRRLAGLGGPAIALEFCVTPDDSPARLNGSGMAIFRPPWGLEARLRETLGQLEEVLCDGRAARAEILKINSDAGGASASAARRVRDHPGPKADCG